MSCGSFWQRIKGEKMKKEEIAAIKNNINEVDKTLLFGRPLMEFSKKQLGAIIVYCFKKEEEQRKEKARQMRVLTGIK